MKQDFLSQVSPCHDMLCDNCTIRPQGSSKCLRYKELLILESKTEEEKKEHWLHYFKIGRNLELSEKLLLKAIDQNQLLEGALAEQIEKNKRQRREMQAKDEEIAKSGENHVRFMAILNAADEYNDILRKQIKSMKGKSEPSPPSPRTDGRSLENHINCVRGIYVDN